MSRSRRAAQKARCSRPATSRAAIASTCRAARSTTSTTTSGATSITSNRRCAVPEGHHTLRFEFEVTGKPDIANGKGAPGRGQLYIDDKLVGQGDIALTMPLTLGIVGGIVCGADIGSPVWDRVQTSLQVHRHASERDRGRQRRSDQGHGSRDADGDGAAVRQPKRR